MQGAQAGRKLELWPADRIRKQATLHEDAPVAQRTLGRARSFSH